MIAIVADTHMPRGGRRLPARCVELLAEAEMAIHAGDFFGTSALEEIRALCPRLHAVYGNVDEPAIVDALPETHEFGLEGSRLAVIHDAGPSHGRLARLRGRFPGVDAVVFGHSHMPLHEEERGFQIFNPGSPTERRRAPQPSMGLLRCEGHRLASSTSGSDRRGSAGAPGREIQQAPRAEPLPVRLRHGLRSFSLQQVVASLPLQRHLGGFVRSHPF